MIAIFAIKCLKRPKNSLFYSVYRGLKTGLFWGIYRIAYQRGWYRILAQNRGVLSELNSYKTCINSRFLPKFIKFQRIHKKALKSHTSPLGLDFYILSNIP
jgi:hypothetical protein